MSSAEKRTGRVVIPRKTQTRIQEVARVKGWDEVRLRRTRNLAKLIIQKMRVNQPFSDDIGRLTDEMGIPVSQLEKYSLINHATWIGWTTREYEVVDPAPITPPNISKFASFFGFSIGL